MEPNFETPRPSRAKTIWLVIVIFLFALSNTAWGLFFYKQLQEKDSLQAKVNNLTSSNDQLSKQLRDQTAKESKAADQRTIPEFEVSYTPDNQTKNLTYSYQINGSTMSTILISTVDLTEKDPGTTAQGSTSGKEFRCSSAYGPLGTITKMSATDKLLNMTPDQLQQSGKTVKKIGDFFYVVTTPSEPCATDPTVQNLLTQYKSIATSLLDSLKPLN